MDHAMHALRAVKPPDDASQRQAEPVADATSVAACITRAFADIERGPCARTGLKPPAFEESNLRRAA
jgi:hypothetical protein